MKEIIKSICPPFIWKRISHLKAKRKSYLYSNRTGEDKISSPVKQDLEKYWDPEFANVLEDWGKDSVWNEIQLLLANCQGKVLDIACGTGMTMKILKIFPNLDVHGFDISDLFIESAISKGIDKEKLRISDAVSTNYNNNEFDYSYSIGSLEHFTEEGIEKFLHESSRYTKKSSFHMIPVSKIVKDLGWITYVQSYFNNSAGWWYDKFIKYYSVVYIIPSKWDDDISFGRWFICVK